MLGIYPPVMPDCWPLPPHHGVGSLPGAGEHHCSMLPHCLATHPQSLHYSFNKGSQRFHTEKAPTRASTGALTFKTLLRLGPEIGQVSTSADRHTLNRFQSVWTYFNICSLPDLWEPLKQLRVAAAQGAEVPQLLQRRADQLLALPHLRPRHIF